MQNKKTYIAIAIIVLISIGLAFFITRNKKHHASAISAVPVDAIFILESNQFQYFIQNTLTKNKIWQNIKNLPSFNNITAQMLALDSLIRNNELMTNILSESSVLLSLHKKSRNSCGLIGYLSLPSTVKEHRIIQFIKSKFKQGQISQRKYEQAIIYKGSTDVNQADKNIFFSVYKNIFLISYSPILLEKAIRQLNLNVSITNDRDYIIISNTAGTNVDANVYVNYHKLHEFAKTFINTNKSNNLEEITNIAEWTELDVSVKNDAFLMNGLTNINDSANNYLNVLSDQPAHKFDIEDIIPSNTAAFFALGINDFDDYNKKYINYIKKHKNIQNYNTTLDQFKKKYKINPKEMIGSFFEDEIGLVFTNLKNYSFSGNTFLVVKTKSKSLADKALNKIIKKHAKENGKEVKSYEHNYKLDNNISYKIKEIPGLTIFELVFGSLFSPAKDLNHYMFIDNYLVFGKSIKSLAGFGYNNTLGKTLVNDIAFKNADKYLSSNSNFYAYINTPDAGAFFDNYLNKNLFNYYKKHKEILEKAQTLILQISSTGNEMLYNNFVLRYDIKIKNKLKTRWESALDTTITFKPAFTINHNTWEKEVFLQDENNDIYLINKSGKILWKKQLNDKIISEIYQIDYYKNKKLQLLFNTKEEMHLIDRNGNYVERYPIKFPTNAINGISVFDYDNNRNYRIFVSCKDKRILDYNKEGDILEGWNFDKSETPVYSKIQHFRVNTKDYIVFSDKYKVYILDRKGEVRVQPEEQFSASTNNHFILEDDKKNPKIVTTDTNGKIFFIYFDGTVESTKIEEYNSSHYFDYQDVDCDNKKDYIFLNKNKLFTFNQTKDQIYSYSFSNTINYEPIYFSFSGTDKRLGIWDKQINKIYLINKNGKLSDDFPLNGNSPFSIGKFDNTENYFNLIVGSKYNFLYNYSLKTN